MSAHLFDVEDAVKYGVNPAIILDHIRRWIAHNKANGKNERDGHTWTYNSVKAWAKLVPYLTDKQVRKAIDDLVAAGVLIKGNYNDNAHDRTLWYALGDGICPTGQMGAETLPSGANGDASPGECVDHRETKEVTKRSELEEEAGRFVDWFLALLARTGAPAPRLTPAIRTGWEQTYEKLVRIDGKTKAEIAKVCEWARSDPFWSGNFYAPTKLRERKDGISRFDLFTAKLNSNGSNSTFQRNSRFCEATARAIQDYAGITNK